MAREYDDIYDIEHIDDDELKQLVLEELGEYPEIDVDLVEVSVEKGVVRVAGRVGTEQELQQVDHVLTDVLGIPRVTNELVIDELVRGERSEAADDALVEDLQADTQTGEQRLRTSDTADHLLEDIESDQYGTHDVGEAIQRGTTYEPPDRPIQEGTRSREQH